MSEHERVAVVGGGIVGSSVAYHLARAGVETTLFDREDDGRATDAGAGIVSAATSSKTDSEAWFELGVRAADYYPELVDALEAAGATDHGYAEADLLSVAFDDDELDPFERAKARSERRADEYGAPEPGSFAEISPERARELFPPLGDAERVVRYRDRGRVDGRRFAAALREAGEREGLTVERADVADLRIEESAVTGVAVDGDWRGFDAAVLAGGAWSGSFEATLDFAVPVEPQRGQIVHIDVDADTADWPIVSPFRHKYLVSWPDGRVAVGATREDGTGFAPHATVEGLHDVYGETLRIAPGVADGTPREVRVGLRPLSRDGLPLLGEVPGVEGAYLATGHGPTGLTLGPYSGRLVAERVRGVETDADTSAFDPARFD
ncbi:NAD(P)/FAD-dependent oxidoreductase [Candidatus Halobonum tyrrellensis]|uniref:Glycine/d-amino acid oxidase, deaminating n=1 Tax=Candidatus Halobonum tyrrellensis G22 TaxID=1324957 RepID=V4HIF3_9EURY|nr:FAD-dependent oxidoreductase [Candidatus Halobonum tyrrellensis]ESP89548.1 glycine/d-amino acid oxidase, deaminating [Candidatus Halobonum tyrrellensis G22]